MLVVYKNKLEKFQKDVVQHSNRHISIIFKSSISEVTFTGSHAPHAWAPPTVKDNYYKELDDIKNSAAKGCNIHYIFGDFNARFVERQDEEATIIGPHFLIHPAYSLDTLSEQMFDTLTRVVEWCTENN